jgi:hypothetical protein
VRYPKIVLSKLRKCKTECERKKVVERMEPSLIAGGMSYKEIIEFNELRKSYAEKLLDNEALIESDTSITMGSGFLTTGTKV